MRVEKELVVNAPVSRVYQLWTDFENFPRFMRHVDSVTTTGDNTYHWIARFGPVTREWDAKIIGLVPDRSVTWRSTSGSENAGAVNLAAQGGVTLMQVVIEYHPSWFEGLFDTLTQEMSRSVEDDLERFKRLAEGGAVGPGPAYNTTGGGGATANPSGVSGAQGATSQSVGAGNAGAYGPSAARAGQPGLAGGRSMSGAATDAAPLTQANALSGSQQGGGADATGGSNLGSMGTDYSTRNGERQSGSGAPPIGETAGTRPPAPVSGAHHSYGGTASSGEAPSGPSLYVDEAAAYTGHPTPGAPIQTRHTTPDNAGRMDTAPGVGTNSMTRGALSGRMGGTATPADEERGTGPGPVGGTGGWGNPQPTGTSGSLEPGMPGFSGSGDAAGLGSSWSGGGETH